MLAPAAASIGFVEPCHPPEAMTVTYFYRIIDHSGKTGNGLDLLGVCHQADQERSKLSLGPGSAGIRHTPIRDHDIHRDVIGLNGNLVRDLNVERQPDRRNGTP